MSGSYAKQEEIQKNSDFFSNSYQIYFCEQIWFPEFVCGVIRGWQKRWSTFWSPSGTFFRRKFCEIHSSFHWWIHMLFLLLFPCGKHSRWIWKQTWVLCNQESLKHSQHSQHPGRRTENSIVHFRRILLRIEEINLTPQTKFQRLSIIYRITVKLLWANVFDWSRTLEALLKCEVAEISSTNGFLER